MLACTWLGGAIHPDGATREGAAGKASLYKKRTLLSNRTKYKLTVEKAWLNARTFSEQVVAGQQPVGASEHAATVPEVRGP